MYTADQNITLFFEIYWCVGMGIMTIALLVVVIEHIFKVGPFEGFWSWYDYIMPRLTFGICKPIKE
jgi:hypothetical protein